MFKYSKAPKLGRTKMGILMESPSPALPVVPSFLPTDISGLQYWYKADSLSLSDGAGISQWDDSGPRNAHATQGSGTLQPLYKTNIKNGLPAVLFDGSNDYFSVPTSSAMTGSTCFCVANLSGSTDNTCVFAWKATSGGNDYDTGNTGLFVSPQSTGTGSFRTSWRGVIEDTQGVTYRQWFVLTTRIKDAGGGNINFLIRYNGAIWDNANQAGSALNATGHTYALGTRLIPNPTAGFYIKNYISELIIYNKDLTDSEITSMETYLNNKWAVY